MKIVATACLCSAAFAGAACGSDASPMAAEPAQWGYAGAIGPEHWASLSDEYAPCGNGKQQSPVDLTGYQESDGGPLDLAYGSSEATVRNDSKFVHADYTAGALTVDQQTFSLLSAHFHAPSEHLIDGTIFAAELHLVHQNADGDLAGLALFLELGEPSPLTQAFLDAAPAEGAAASASISLNDNGYMPTEMGYYRYDGSKTTPPCDEPVVWYVLRGTRTISQEQIDGLQALSGGPSNRPVQPIGDRKITVGGVREIAQGTTCPCCGSWL